MSQAPDGQRNRDSCHALSTGVSNRRTTCTVWNEASSLATTIGWYTSPFTGSHIPIGASSSAARSQTAIRLLGPSRSCSRVATNQRPAAVVICPQNIRIARGRRIDTSDLGSKKCTPTPQMDFRSTRTQGRLHNAERD